MNLQRGKTYDVLWADGIWFHTAYLGQVRIEEDEKLQHAFMRTDVEGSFMYVDLDRVDEFVRLP